MVASTIHLLELLGAVAITVDRGWGRQVILGQPVGNPDATSTLGTFEGDALIEVWGDVDREVLSELCTLSSAVVERTIASDQLSASLMQSQDELDVLHRLVAIRPRQARREATENVTTDLIQRISEALRADAAVLIDSNAIWAVGVESLLAPLEQFARRVRAHATEHFRVREAPSAGQSWSGMVAPVGRATQGHRALLAVAREHARFEPSDRKLVIAATEVLQTARIAASSESLEPRTGPKREPGS